MIYIQSHSLLVFTKQFGRSSPLDHFSQDMCQLRVCNLIKVKAGAVYTHPNSVHRARYIFSAEVNYSSHTSLISVLKKMVLSCEGLDDPLNCSEE